MTTRIGVAVMAVLLGLYLFVAIQYAIVAFAAGTLVGTLMGLGLAVLGAVGVWGLVRELLFGVRAGSLGRTLEAEGGLPDEEISARASGRPLREEADRLFPAYATAVENEPGSWRAWYRLGLAYDASGDRRRARGAIRRSISLARDAR